MRRSACRPADAVLRPGDARRCRGGEEVSTALPVQYRYEGNIFSGEKRTELLVVPALSVRVSPRSRDRSGLVIRRTPATPAARQAAADAGARRPQRRRPHRARGGRRRSRDIRVTVVNDTPGATRERRDARAAARAGRRRRRSSR